MTTVLLLKNASFRQFVLVQGIISFCISFDGRNFTSPLELRPEGEHYHSSGQFTRPKY